MNFTDEKEKMRSELKIYSYLMLFLAVLNAAIAALQLMSGDIQLAAKALGDVGKASLIILITLTAILVLIQLWMGIQGLRTLKGTAKGKSHIILSRVIMVILIISLVTTVVSTLMNGGSFNYTDLAITLVDIIVFYSYARAAKACLNS